MIIRLSYTHIMYDLILSWDVYMFTSTRLSCQRPPPPWLKLPRSTSLGPQVS